MVVCPSVEIAYSAQLFSLEGQRWTLPGSVPSYCAAAARTKAGSEVCDRGCGFPPGGPPAGVPFQTFTCPFGVSNAMLLVQRDKESSDVSGSATGPAGWLVGGRVFASYAQFSGFVDRAVAAGAQAAEILEGCERIRFQDAGKLRPLFEEMAERARSLIPEPADLPKAADLPEPADLPKAADLPEPADLPKAAGLPEPADLPKPADLPEPASVAPPDSSIESTLTPKVSSPMQDSGSSVGPDTVQGMGVPPFQAMEERFAKEVARCKRYDHPMAMALLRVNTSAWLPENTDQKEKIRELIARGVARILRSVIRSFDLITSCWPGRQRDELSDTLVFLFPETSRERTDRALRRLLILAQDRFLSRIPGQRGPAGSLFFEGVFAEYPTDGRTLESLMAAMEHDLLAEPPVEDPGPFPEGQRLAAPDRSSDDEDEVFTPEDLASGFQGGEEIPS